MTSIRNQTLQFIVATAMCVASLSASAASGTWTNLMTTGAASGSWGIATNWLNGIIASNIDTTADFSTLDLTNGVTTVTLDGNRTNGFLVIGDTAPNTNWTFNAGTPTTSSLTLLTSAGQPAINVSNQFATFGAPIFSANGFLKTGAGTLRMNSANTNAAGATLVNWLNGTVIASNGVLQCGNGSIGIYGNQNGTNRVVVLDGATVEVISAIGVNNKHLQIAGNGVGGTKGAIYAFPPTNFVNGTRWGLSSVNDSGVSANSSSTFPAISLASNATVNVDGLNYSYTFLMGYTTCTNNVTLTKTGLGRISFDRGANVSNIVINAGSVSPNSASAFGAVQTWTVNNGGALLNWQNGCFGNTCVITVNAGGLFDVNGRNDTAGGLYTQNIGVLQGAGTVTCGSNTGNAMTNTLVINSATSNSVFSGTITAAAEIFHITKNGAGTSVILSGTNSYNGITTINAGIWLVDGKHNSASNYVVAASGTLGGKGSINQGSGCNITLNGNLVAGDNGGTLTVSNVVGSGNVIVSNANLTTTAQLNNSGSGSFTSVYLTNSTTTALLQQNGTEAAIYTSALNVDGTNTLAFTSANPATGQYPFIKYGSIGGLDGFSGLKLSLASGFAAYLSNNVANSSVDIVITAIPALVWRGTPTGDWTIGGSANWLNAVTPSAYTEISALGPFVIFDDSATGTASVNVISSVTPKGITVSSSTKNYIWSGGGTVTTAGSVVKDGSSTLTLANTNAFGGTLTINNGAVAIGSGGTSGSVGAASVLVNSGSLIFNRSDNVTIANTISGAGSLVKSNANTVTLTGVGSIGSIAANAGTLALGPSGTITVSGDVTGGGTFGINSAGKVILTSGTITYSGGSLIAGGGTLEFDSVFPPSGTITDNGTLALGVGGTFSDNIVGTGGLTLLNAAGVTLSGANTYAGATRVLGGSALTADAANYPAASVLVLGSTNGVADIGAATFNSGNPVLAGLIAGGNSTSPGDPLTLAGSGQTLTVNGNIFIGNSAPSGASVYLPVTGSGASLTVNTNGGVFQLGLGNAGSGVNPDNILVDFSGLDNFTANLGTNGVLNLGTLDGNPGPPTGATVVNQFKLANLSNSITAGQINVGAGGRQLVPELMLGAGTNILNTTTLSAGFGGRDGSYVHFGSGTGGLRLRGLDGVSRAAFLVGNNPGTGTGASITNTVDFTGHPVDLFINTLNIGNYNNAGVYGNSFSFDTGTLDAQSTALSLIRNNNGANAAASGSSLNIGGGTASLGPVNLTASVAAGTLNITGGNVTVANITSPGAGVATLNVANASLKLALTNSGNPVAAPVTVDSLMLDTAVTLNVGGTNWVVGQFPLMSYTGSIGGTGYSALTLGTLPSGCAGYLSNNVAALSVDLVVTSAPLLVNTNATNIVAVVNGANLELSWPADHIGWRLQAQTNSLANGLNNNWVSIPGTATVNHFTNTVDATKGSVFYRMVYP